MWFNLADVDLGFTSSSPNQIVTEAVLFAPADRVFDTIVDDAKFKEWFTDLEDVRWTSESRGVGSTREVELAMLTVKERFLAWDRGARLSFAITAITLPIAKRMLEDIRLEREGERRTRIVWTVHYEPSMLMRPVHPLARMVFGKMFRSSLRNLVKMAES